MSWFGLQPAELANSIRNDPARAHRFTARHAAFTGMWRFGLVSLAVYGLWAFGGRFFYRHLGEGGFYLVCAMAFISLCGGLLPGLVVVRMPAHKFFALFGGAFALYAAGWSAGWFALGAGLGEWLASGVGTGLMAMVLCRVFGRGEAFPKVFVALFILHTIGYFMGSLFYGWLSPARYQSPPVEFISRAAFGLISKFQWGFFHGAFFGAGIGLAFYYCQEATIRETTQPNTNPGPPIVGPSAPC